MWNWIGVREPSRSSMSLTPDVGVDDERDLDPDQAQLPAQVVLDVVLDDEDRLLRLARGQQRVVVLRQDLLELRVVADAGPGRSASLLPAIMVDVIASLVWSGSTVGSGRPFQPGAGRATGQGPISRLGQALMTDPVGS